MHSHGNMVFLKICIWPWKHNIQCIYCSAMEKWYPLNVCKTIVWQDLLLSFLGNMTSICWFLWHINTNRQRHRFQKVDSTVGVALVIVICLFVRSAQWPLMLQYSLSFTCQLDSSRCTCRVYVNFLVYGVLTALSPINCKIINMASELLHMVYLITININSGINVFWEFVIYSGN